MALVAQDIDEHAVAALVVKALDCGFEDTVVIHGTVLARPRFNRRSRDIPLRTTRN
jgi:hypothetical protein